MDDSSRDAAKPTARSEPVSNDNRTRPSTSLLQNETGVPWHSHHNQRRQFACTFQLAPFQPRLREAAARNSCSGLRGQTSQKSSSIVRVHAAISKRTHGCPGQMIGNVFQGLVVNGDNRMSLEGFTLIVFQPDLDRSLFRWLVGFSLLAPAQPREFFWPGERQFSGDLVDLPFPDGKGLNEDVWVVLCGYLDIVDRRTAFLIHDNGWIPFIGAYKQGHGTALVSGAHHHLRPFARCVLRLIQDDLQVVETESEPSKPSPRTGTRTAPSRCRPWHP